MCLFVYGTLSQEDECSEDVNRVDPDTVNRVSKMTNEFYM